MSGDEESPEWDGRVLEVDGDIFTAELRREGYPDLLADFSMAHCGITVEPGDLIIVRPSSVTKRDLGVLPATACSRRLRDAAQPS